MALKAGYVYREDLSRGKIFIKADSESKFLKRRYVA